MKINRRNITDLSLLLSIPVLNIIYRILNHGEEGAYSLMTDLDRGIPFLKVFIIPYVIWYGFLIGTLIYFFLKDRRTYYQILLSLNIGILLCYGIYFFYQTTVPRPTVAGEDLLSRLVVWVYAADQPFNCFPSIHSLTSYLMFKGIRLSSVRSRQNQLVIFSLTFTIILSTLFVKQHTVLDALAAVFLGDVLFNFVHYRLWTKLTRIRYIASRQKTKAVIPRIN